MNEMATIACTTDQFRPGDVIGFDDGNGRRFLVVERVHRGVVIVGRPRLRDWLRVVWVRVNDAWANVLWRLRRGGR